MYTAAPGGQPSDSSYWPGDSVSNRSPLLGDWRGRYPGGSCCPGSSGRTAGYGSGIGACRQIRSERPEARVLMLTSYSDEEAGICSLIGGWGGLFFLGNPP